MAKTIAIFNQKGGVGKSTTATNLMAEFVKKGYRVLGIDIDSQGHLSKFCNINTQDQNTIIELLRGEADFVGTVQTTNYGDVIPADRNLQYYLQEFANDINNVFLLQEITEQQANNYDYIIIDCPPNANQITTAALIAANYVVVPTEAEFFSLDGVSEISRTIQTVQKKLNRSLKVLGVLIVKYQPRRTLTKKIEEFMKEAVKQFLSCKLFETKIPYSVSVPEAQTQGKSVYDFNPNSKAAIAYDEFATEVLTKMAR